MSTKTLAGVLTMVAAGALLPGPGKAQPANVQAARVVEQKMAIAQKFFAEAWADLFRSVGRKFAPPRVVTFLGSMKTACGEVRKGNGFTCPADNTIYMDEEFLVQNMNKAAADLRTDGDFAAIVIGAHEVGHVVAIQLNAVSPSKEFASEQVADCFAGVITRRAKTDGLLDPGDLEEGLLSLATAGDEVGSKVNPRDFEQSIRFIVLNKGLSHGFIEQRQAAFLQGYYAGPPACAVIFGQPHPPAAGQVIVSSSLTPPWSAPAVVNSNCVTSSSTTGLRIHNTHGSGQCEFNLMPPGKALPDHLRIELTVQYVPPGNFRVGIYYGDGHFGLTPYAFETNQMGGNSIKNIDRLSERIGGLRLNGMPWNLEQINKRGQNRLTLDIHHIGLHVYFLTYVNGLLTECGHSVLTNRPGAVRGLDEAGVSLDGTEAIFRDFRVMALPN